MNSIWGTKLSIKGNNQLKLINTCVENGIAIKNLVKYSSDCMEFVLNDKDYKKFNNLDIVGYEINIISLGGLKRLWKLFIARIGIVCGLAISIIAVSLINHKLFNIKIVGNNNVSSNEIVNSVNNFGLHTFSNLDFDTNQLESYLIDEFNFSFVSIATMGNTLLISVKEELPDFSKEFAPIYADYDMVISSINVFAGTSKISVGDIVYKGDILVEPYFGSGEDIVYVKPCAVIEGSIFSTSTYQFYNSEKIKVKTGKHCNVSTQISLGKWQFATITNDCIYEDYEIISTSNYVTNYFLPIKFDKVLAYELKTITIEHNFNEEKEDIVNKLKLSAYSKLPTNINNASIDEMVDIVAIDGGYIVNVYLKSQIKLEYR